MILKKNNLHPLPSIARCRAQHKLFRNRQQSGIEKISVMMSMQNSR